MTLTLLRRAVLAAGVIAMAASAPAAQIPEDATAEDGYTVWLCPMHRDHQAHEEGHCPLCGMALVQRTLVTRYVCLGDEDGVVEEEPGICPDTGDPLVPATREVVWFCPDAPDRFFVEPGTCASGAPRDMTSRVSEHGDHNPRHGGILFMAPDGVHHLEGALEDGAFRLYFYDSFTRPVEPTPFAARVVEADDRGAPIGEPVTLAGGADFLEAPFATDPEGRSAFTAFVRFPETPETVGVEAEQRFDFIFLSESERAALAEAAGTVRVAGGLPELRIPGSAEEILREIHDRDRRVQALIEAGRWADLFIPALEAKDLALAYSEKAPEPRPWAALKQIVRGAWLLDMYGDLGDRVRVGEAYVIFAAGMAGLADASP